VPQVLAAVEDGPLSHLRGRHNPVLAAVEDGPLGHLRGRHLISLSSLYLGGPSCPRYRLPWGMGRSATSTAATRHR